VAEHAAGNLDLAVGCAIDHVVERCRHVAQKLVQARSVRRFTGKHKAAVTLHARQVQHRSLGILGIEIARIAVLQRHRLEPAVEMIGPAVIAALEFARPASAVGNDQTAAMGALVVDDANLAPGVAH
jgi:hypothetical protein